MKKIDECIIESDIKKQFFVKEKGKVFKLECVENFYCEVISIDDCVFAESELRRCDYLFLVSGKNNKNERFGNSKAFYIELKGNNIRSACEQLYNAIVKTKTQILNHEIKAKVIGTKGFQPNMINNDFYRKVRKVIKREIEFHRVHKANGYMHTEVI